MNLEEYQIEAEEDVIIDRNKIDRTAAELPTKTAKWLRYHNKEKIKLKALEQQRDKVKSEKFAYYAGYSKPAYIYSLGKHEIKEFLVADEELQSVERMLEIQQITVDYITEVVATLNRSGFTISNYIKWNVFQAGEY